MNKIPFSPPYIDEEVEKEILDSLRSGWITTGPKVKQLEVETAKVATIENVLCVNSATSGLMLALHWFGIGPGDEVIVPAYTYCATALVVKHLGAVPIIVDVKEDFNIDPLKVREAITSKTKAIIPVDFGGWPCDYDAIYEVVKNSEIFQAVGEVQKILGRILILADAAHSFGAKYKGKKVGVLADLTVFSFHAVKNLTTAEGGAVCFNLPEPFSNGGLYQTFRLWSLNGQTKDAFTKSQGGSWRYDVVYPGFKINMPDVCAAIGLAQIRKYESVLLKERKRVFETYYELFNHEEWAECPVAHLGDSETSYHIFALRLKPRNENIRDLVISEAATKGISLNVHFIPLPELSVFKEMGYDSNKYPVALDNFISEISLPVYPQLTAEDCHRIFNSIKGTVINNKHVAIP